MVNRPKRTSLSCHSSGRRVGVADDFAVWLNAPKERSPEYFPTYSAMSRAIQTTLRGWVRDWFYAHQEVLRRYHTAYQIIVYFCTHPFRGRPTNIFTYDIQRREAVERAFASAAYKLGRVLKTLETRDLPWDIREDTSLIATKNLFGTSPKIIVRCTTCLMQKRC